MANPNLLDIAKHNGSDAVVGLIEEASKAHPEITIGYARTIAGLNYKTLVRTAVPTGSSFRKANAGTSPVKSTYENRLVETYILNPRWECDRAVADRHEDGKEAYIAIEGGGIMEGSMQDICQQFYYGTNATYGNANGFPGLLQAYDSTKMVVDAGGTTDNVASSVWAVKFSPRDVTWVWGQDGMLEMDDPRIESVIDAGGTNKFTAYVQELLAYPGLQVGSLYSIGRIKKLTNDSGKGLTDDLISELLSKFPVGVVPDVLLMSRRSVMQLQQSRTATNATGVPAPFPTEAFGIPIEKTDAISNVEKLAL